MTDHHLHPNLAAEVRIDVTPESAGWRYLSFRELALKAGSAHIHHTNDTEVAIVPLSGEGVVRVGRQSFTLARESVFAGKPHVVYVPPKHDIAMEAKSDLEFTLGGAPAEGKYPVRMFKPEEMKSEMRGGG